MSTPRTVIAGSASEDVGSIGGITPAEFISFSTSPRDKVTVSDNILVDAPVDVCFKLWDDWNRLVDFMDVVAQIGLDPKQPRSGLFQCYYRWGQLPVMELTFLVRKTEVKENEFILFESTWGMPLEGFVKFESVGSKTNVSFHFQCQLPLILVELKVGVLGVFNSLRGIFADNLAEFKRLAEELAHKPEAAPPRRDALPKAPDEMPDFSSLTQVQKEKLLESLMTWEAGNYELSYGIGSDEGDVPNSSTMQDQVSRPLSDEPATSEDLSKAQLSATPSIELTQNDSEVSAPAPQAKGTRRSSTRKKQVEQSASTGIEPAATLTNVTEDAKSGAAEELVQSTKQRRKKPTAGTSGTAETAKQRKQAK